MKKEKKVKSNKKTSKGFFRKRNVILAITLLLVVSISACLFTSCKKKDEQEPEFVYEQASTMLETPTDGSRPSDHEAKNNAYYAFYAMNVQKSFTTEMSGESVTKVALASVKQSISGSRVINNGEIYKESLSHSTFKGVGARTFVKGDNYVVHDANDVKSISEVTWNESANRISKEDFLNKFGYVPNSITGYIFTDETILSAEFLGEENGIYSFSYELDPVKSTSLLGVEMRTMAGSKSVPTFEKATVIIRMNADWQVTEVVNSSVYEVDILGGVTCTESLTEKFSNYNQGIPVPNAEFYNSYVDAEISAPEENESLTATDYLTEAFGDYISGAKPIKAQIALSTKDSALSANLDAEIKLNINDLDNTKIKLNLNDLNYGDVTLNDVFLALDNGNIYLKKDDFKVVTNMEEISGVLDKVSALSETNLSSSLGALTSLDLGNVNFESLISGATMQESGDTVIVSLPISLGDVNINANLFINKGEKNTLSKITATIGELNVSLTINDNLALQEIGEGYNSIAHLLDFIDENGNIKADVNLGDISAKLNINLKTLEIDAYIEDLAIEGVSLGEVKLKLKDDVIYADALGLKVKLELSDIETLLNKITSIVGTEIAIPDLSSLENIDVLELVGGALSTLEISENQNQLSISAKVLGYDLSAVLLITERGYEMKGVSLDIDETQISVNVYSGEIPTIEDGLENYNDILPLLDIVNDENEINLKINAFDMDIDVCFNLLDLTLYAKTELFGETIYAKLVDNKIYLSYKGLNVYASLDEVDTVLSKLEPLVGELALPDFSNISIDSILNSLSVTDGEELSITLNIGDISLTAILDKTNGLTLSKMFATIEELDISAVPSTKADYSGMTANKYYNIVTLLDVLDEDYKLSISAEAFNTTVYATIDLLNSEILVKLDDFEILIDLNDNMLYARYPGANLKLELSKVNYVINELKPLLAKFISEEELESINLDGLKDISIEEIISSITVIENENSLTLSLSLAGINADIVLGTQNDNLALNGGVIKMNEMEISFTTTKNALNFAFDKNANYVDLASVVENLAPALRNILTLDNLYASMTAKIVKGNQIFELTECEVLISNIYTAPRARVNLTLKITTINPDGTTKVSEHKIELFYLDPSLVGEGGINTYFTYDDTSNQDVFAGTFTTVNFYETLDILKQIYFNMPELQDALKPFIVKGEDGMPTLPEIDVALNKLFNAVSFANGTLSIDLNGKSVWEDLSSSVLIEVFSQNGLLCLDLKDATIADMTISLNASVGEAPSGLITDDKFTFTPLSTASDFSSINDLLKALEKTSEKRHFFIDARVDMNGSGLLSWLKIEDKINIDLYLDVIDGKTYFKAILDRKNVNLLIMDVWKDYSGTGYIYFDPDTQIIYVHNEYVMKEGTFFRPKYVTYHEYLKYTVDEFMADPLNNIFDILRISDSLRDTINGETSKEKVSTATIENTFKSYSYSNSTFNITLDLAPLTTDIKTTTVNIKHDSDYNLTSLNASANMINIIDLKLSATLTTSETSYGTDVAVKGIANDPNFA